MVIKYKPQVGRPSIYTPELAEKVCDAIATTAASLRSICESRKEFPSKDAVLLWVKNKPEFADMYFKARESQAEALLDKCMDSALEDEESKTKDNMVKIARARLKVDTCKGLAVKLNQARYSERIKNDNTNVNQHENDLKNLK